jgi:hypothetical protein
MRSKIIASAAVMFLGGAGVLTFAVPAFAATAGDTPVTVQVNGPTGGLSISAPSSSVLLGTATASVAAQTVTGSLGNVVVTDNRAGNVGWTATVSATNFTGPQTILTTVFGNVVYTAPAATDTGIVTTVAGTQSTLSPGGPVQNATAVSGVNTATWNPSIAVLLPAGAQAGTYSSTFTHSVA